MFIMKNFTIFILTLFAIFAGGSGIAIIISKYFSLLITIKPLANIVAQTDYLSAWAFVIMGTFSECLAMVIKKRVML